VYADSSRRQNKRVEKLRYDLCKGKLAGVWGAGIAPSLPRKSFDFEPENDDF